MVTFCSIREGKGLVAFFAASYMVNIDVPAGVSAPPLDTQLLNMQVQTKSVSLAKWGTRSILQRIHPKTRVF